MSVDDATRAMLENVYIETVEEAMASGSSRDVAHKEALTAAAMLLASMAKIADDKARAEVDGLGFSLDLIGA